MSNDPYIVPTRRYALQYLAFDNVWFTLGEGSMENCKTIRRFMSEADEPILMRTLYVGTTDAVVR